MGTNNALFGYNVHVIVRPFVVDLMLQTKVYGGFTKFGVGILYKIYRARVISENRLNDSHTEGSKRVSVRIFIFLDGF